MWNRTARSSPGEDNFRIMCAIENEKLAEIRQFSSKAMSTGTRLFRDIDIGSVFRISLFDIFNTNMETVVSALPFAFS